jgi:uncharacterized protein DUF3892
MASLQVTCVTTRDPARPEGITHLGGAGWRKTREQVVAEIDAGVNDFYTLAGGSRAVVVVVRPTGMAAYVRTTPDRTGRDNLLSLPPCP